LKNRGKLITLEGIDGSGKSTQLRLLLKHLRLKGYCVLATREPGGTYVGDQIRRVLLASPNQNVSPLTELALMYAARAQDLEDVVRPALARGEIVLIDRFNDASIAYQGYGRRLGPALVRAFDRIICGQTQPDLTLVLDLAPRIALRRAAARESRRNSAPNRFEAEGMKFHTRVRNGYLGIARKEPQRVRVIRTDRPIAEVAAEIASVVDGFLAAWNRAGKMRSSKCDC
jgi:dTMP kinase